MVGRFDRLWTRDGRLLRLPQEDCCQALSVPPTRKYEPDGGPGIRQIFDMSAQLNVDAGEIRHNRMKLAMAVGDRRRYVIDQIMPRHFLQTPSSAGIQTSLVQGILDEIENARRCTPPTSSRRSRNWPPARAVNNR